MNKYIKLFFRIFTIQIPTFYNSVLSGISFNLTHKIVGRPHVIKASWYQSFIFHEKSGKIYIGDNFRCNNTVESNSIGLIQPCIFNIRVKNSMIKIGNNVGISGSTLNATTSISIGNNVLIGSGCIITDTDSHPIHYDDRNNNRNNLTAKAPIVIEDNVFIGARSIILKGVIIGEGSVVGAGSVVSKDVPPHSVVCGNPARIVKSLK